MAQNLQYKITLDASQFSKEQRKVIDSFEKNASKFKDLNINKRIFDKNQFRNDLKDAGNELRRSSLASGIGGLVKAYVGMHTVKGVINSGLRMESARANIKGALHGKTVAELQEINNIVDDLAKQIPKSKEDIAKSIQFLAQQIKDPMELKKSALNIDMAATAFGIDATQAAQEYLTLANNFKLNAEQGQDLIDKITTAHMKNPTAQVGQILTGLNMVSSMKGVGQDQLLAMITTAIKSGVDPSMAATGFRSAMQVFGGNLSKGSKGIDSIFKDLGINKKEMNALFKVDRMTALMKLLDAVSKSEKYKGTEDIVLSKLTGTYGGKTLQFLMSSVGSYQEMLNTFTTGGHLGSAHHATASRLETEASKLYLLQNAFTSLNEQITNRLNPTLKLFTDGLTGAINGLADFMKPENRGETTNTVIDSITGGLTAATILSTVSSAAKIGSKFLGGSVLGGIASATRLTSPLGLGLTALGAVATAGYGYYERHKNQQKMSEIGHTGRDIQNIFNKPEKVAVDINVNDVRTNFAVRRQEMPRTSGYGI